MWYNYKGDNMINKNGKYKLTRNGYSKRKTHPYIYEIAKGYDKYGFMSKELGMELSALFEDGYKVGIHRTGHTIIGPKTIADVFHNGLINNGDTMIGSVNDDGWIDSSDTITFFNDFLIMNGQIKVANKYKNSQGVFVVKIPTAYLERTNEYAKPIYFMGNEPRLLPEYIYGYIPVDKNGRCGDIIRNPLYKNVHFYKHNGLYYDSNTGVSNNINM